MYVYNSAQTLTPEARVLATSYVAHPQRRSHASDALTPLLFQRPLTQSDTDHPTRSDPKTCIASALSMSLRLSCHPLIHARLRKVTQAKPAYSSPTVPG